MHMMKKFTAAVTMRRLSLFLLLLGLVDVSRAMEYFPLNQIRLLDSPFKEAQERNIDYMLALEPDRLLAPYLREAGLEPTAKNYGNWESSGLDGHIGGHYLSALSLAWAATGRQDIRDRLEYMLGQLQRAQRQNGNGYIGGVPGSDKLWKSVAAGDIQADLFSLNGAWVPWYNVHKMFAGLRDAWLYAGSEQARDMLIAFADWADQLVADLNDDQMQMMLQAEYGGMNEVFADVAEITGEKRYLKLARRFSHQLILKPLLKSQDQLNGLHANTQIPKVVGFERVAEIGKDKAWHQAADFFWDTVVNERSVAIGGNSVREHFHDKSDFTPMMEDVEGPETCNTYNMLKLTRLLYRDSPKQKYVDYYERALYNHILSSQDTATGGLVYFTPMRPQHYRVYSQVDESMWCCVGSGIENHVKYGEFIYARDGDALFINLFIPSHLEWPEKEISLRQENQFPDQPGTRIVFENDSDIRLKLRYPTWASSEQPVVRVNGRTEKVTAAAGSYITLKRNWKKGDTVSLDLPMTINTEQLPDGSDYYAILYGPIVLAAETSPFPGESLNFYADDSRMGHIASGPTCPVEQVPIFVSPEPDFDKHIGRIDGNELRFRIASDAGLQGPGGTELIPFFRLHRSRYMLYWPYSTPEKLKLRQQLAVAEEAEKNALAALTLDTVSPGEQQPEVEHHFAAKDSEAGVNFDRHWRHSRSWFGYTLSDPNGEGRFLRIVYWGADRDRNFAIEMNGVIVADVKLTGEHGANFVSVDYPLPGAVLEKAVDGRHQLRFIAAENSVAGGIYGVSLLKGLPETSGSQPEK